MSLPAQLFPCSRSLACCWRAFGWLWMDPLAGVIGALVIANWAWGLMCGTGAILLDMNTDRRMAENVRHRIEASGDQVLDLHGWRLGPGRLSEVVAVATSEAKRGPGFYHATLKQFKGLAHVSVEFNPARAAG
jgi:Co/Zn/Cd efflux system component